MDVSVIVVIVGVGDGAGSVQRSVFLCVVRDGAVKTGVAVETVILGRREDCLLQFDILGKSLINDVVHNRYNHPEYHIKSIMNIHESHADHSRTVVIF